MFIVFLSTHRGSTRRDLFARRIDCKRLDRRERLEFLTIVAQLDTLIYRIAGTSSQLVADMAESGVRLQKAVV